MIRAAHAYRSLLALAGVGQRLVTFRRLEPALREYASAAPYLRRGTTVLALHFDRHHAWPSRYGTTWRRVDPFLHAVGTLAVERDVVNLRSYQAIKSYFPLAFRPERNPIFRMGTQRRRPAGILQHPFSASMARYEKRSDGRVDTVLLWGPQAGPGETPAGRAVLRELAERYELRFISEPRGWMRVYRRRPDSS